MRGSANHATAGWWFKPEFIINNLNINGAIAHPWHKDAIPKTQKTMKISGYAYSGGGRRVSTTRDASSSFSWLPCCQFGWLIDGLHCC